MKPKYLYLLLLLCFLSVPINAQNITEEYKDAVREMFDLSGTKKIYNTVLDGLFDVYKRQDNEIPDEVWDDLKKGFKGEALTELEDSLIPVYFQYFSLEDIKSLNAFYVSPIGKKLVKKTPLIMQDAMSIGEAWGKNIGSKFLKKLEEKGY